MTDQSAPDPDARRDVLASALEAHEAAGLPAPADAPAHSLQEAPAGRVRDETGKFAKAGEAAKTAPQTLVEQTVNPEPEPEWSKPPKSWKPEKHGLWETASPELREYAFQREQEMAAGVEPLKTKAQIADQFQQTIAPYEQTIRGLGMQPIDAVKQLMEADRLLRTLPTDQKLPYLAQLARGYGINLTGDATAPTMAPVQPEIYTLQNELTNVRGMLQGLTQQQEAAQAAALQSEITNFAAKAPYFEQAQPTMAKLLQGGLATGLEDAYEQAVRLDPALFAQSQAEQAAKAQAERDQAAKAAKAAAVSPRSSTPGAITAPKATDRRSMIAELADNLEGRF